MAYPYGASNAVSFGPFSASTLQQPSSIAIGASAGRKNQGGNAIAIGTLAGQLNQNQSTIVLNATGQVLNTANDNATYLAPLRFTTASNLMVYNSTSKEVSYSDTISGSLNVTGNATANSYSVASAAITYNNTSDKGKWFKIATVPSRGVGEIGVSWSAAGEHGYNMISFGQQFNNTPFIRVIEGDYYGTAIVQQFRLALDNASIYNDAYVEMYLANSSWYSTDILINTWIVNKPPVISAITLFTTKTSGTSSGYSYYQVCGYHPMDINWNGARLCLANTGNVGIGTNDPGSLFHVKEGRMSLSVYRAPFTGLEAYTSANRAQFVLSSSYSDLVIASSEVNNNHGSTLTFASYNPADGSQYRKWVVNQGNWGSRVSMLDFGYSDYSVTNPHNNIDATNTVMTMDGINKRVGIGSTNPGANLDIQGYIRLGNFTGGSYDNIKFVRGTGAGEYPNINCQSNYIFMYSSGAGGWITDTVVGDMGIVTNKNIRFGTGQSASSLWIDTSGYVHTNYVPQMDYTYGTRALALDSGNRICFGSSVGKLVTDNNYIHWAPGKNYLNAFYRNNASVNVSIRFRYSMFTASNNNIQYPTIRIYSQSWGNYYYWSPANFQNISNAHTTFYYEINFNNSISAATGWFDIYVYNGSNCTTDANDQLCIWTITSTGSDY